MRNRNSLEIEMNWRPERVLNRISLEYGGGICDTVEVASAKDKQSVKCGMRNSRLLMLKSEKRGI